MRDLKKMRFLSAIFSNSPDEMGISFERRRTDRAPGTRNEWLPRRSILLEAGVGA